MLLQQRERLVGGPRSCVLERCGNHCARLLSSARLAEQNAGNGIAARPQLDGDDSTQMRGSRQSDAHAAAS
jgi:hypothetical protein